MSFAAFAKYAARRQLPSTIRISIHGRQLQPLSFSLGSAAGRRCTSTVRQSAPLTTVASPIATDGTSPVADVQTSDQPAEGKKKEQSLIGAYLELSKARLSALVVITSGAGFLLAGLPIDWATCAATVTGTSLAAAAANTFNQVYEIKPDGMMMRTQRRPLPSGRLTRAQAIRFGLTAAAVGTGILWIGTNPLTTALGLGNIILYAGIYTPLKQVTTLNTAVGAIVGAIPPLMGWSAATGSLLALDPLLLGYILFAWQLPHFYALAWLARKDYTRGGYHMVPVFDATGSKTARLIMRHSLGLCMVPFIATALGVTSPMFMVDATILNGYLVYLARKFKANPSDPPARAIFRMSLWYLPVLMILMVFHSSMWNTKEEQLAAKLRQYAPIVPDSGSSSPSGASDAAAVPLACPVKDRGTGIGEGIEHAITCGRLVGRAWCAHELVVHGPLSSLAWLGGGSSHGTGSSGSGSSKQVDGSHGGHGGAGQGSGSGACPIPLPSALKHTSTGTDQHHVNPSAAMVCPVVAVEHGAAKVGEAVGDVSSKVSQARQQPASAEAKG